MAVTTAIVTAATTGASLIAGNQQKQKAKGQSDQIERDSAAAQAAADAQLKQRHDQGILDQSQAGAIARKKLEKPLAPSPQSPTLLTPTLPSPVQPIQRKTLLGQ